MNKLFNLNDPFFAPKGRRMAVVAITAIWGLIELSAGATGWAIGFLAVSAYCAWQFSKLDYGTGTED